MRTAHLPSSRRWIAALVLAVLCAPAPMLAEDEPEEASASELPPPVESHWYDRIVREADIAFDLLFIRPAAGVTAAAGVVLFVPAVILTSPNGWDSMTEAYERFVREPGEYFVSRPLGEF